MKRKLIALAVAGAMIAPMIAQANLYSGRSTQYLIAEYLWLEHDFI